jgi:hypothetical protein
MGATGKLMCWRPSKMHMIAQHVAKYDVVTLALAARCYSQGIAQSAVCLMTGPQPLPKAVLQGM